MIYIMLTIITFCPNLRGLEVKYLVNTWYVHVCELPHWSVCDFGVWLGLTHWKRLCYSLHVHTHRVSLLCVNANVSSGSPVWSRPLNSLQTEREKDTQLH